MKQAAASEESRFPWLQRAWGATCLVASLACGATVFVMVDDRWGRALAIAAVSGFVLVPLGVAGELERIALRVEIVLRARLIAMQLTHLALLVLLLVRFPAETGGAYARFPEKYGVHGPVGAAVRRAGLWLGGALAPAAPGATPSVPVVSSPPPDGGPPAFSSGDLSYREADCEPLADVSSLATTHDGGPLRPTVEALARARYPAGLPFLAAQDDAALRVWFTGAGGTFEEVASRFDVAVHEGAHMWRIKQGLGSYPVSATLTIPVRPIPSFPRSEILATHVDAAGDSYAKTYLEGASGAQGFDSLLDEYTAYAHSLAARYCTRDLMRPNSRVSARDGVLTMMYYVESYLALARVKHPREYAAISGDAAHRRLIAAVWDRAELWLRRSAGIPSLGVADGRIAAWVYAPERLAEMRRLRDLDRTAPSAR